MKRVFKKNWSGIRKLLQSQECLNVMEKYASQELTEGEIRPFIGFDRAKVFVKTSTERSEELKKSNRAHKNKK